MTVACAKSSSAASENANHRPRSTSAAALTRCTHQCSTPPLAEPSPNTRFNGVTRLKALPSDDRDRCIDHGGRDGDRDDGPPARANLPPIETETEIPDEVANAVREVVEEAEHDRDERQLHPPAAEERRRALVALAAARDGEEPPR